MTDAYASEQGLYASRTEGSNDNIAKWTSRLKAAWKAAVAVRAQTLARPANQRRLFRFDPSSAYFSN
ncbi:hypothetical protein [Peristeroidobacter agariperforans]|uniref:hypothetical protein n=1 Tax=Peristeroidobacter agariperforans TaxID=268404 RepID=UPI00101BC0A7|nr:hypothetical protein [Peristeroidobacter agariperforans]